MADPPVWSRAQGHIWWRPAFLVQPLLAAFAISFAARPSRLILLLAWPGAILSMSVALVHLDGPGEQQRVHFLCPGIGAECGTERSRLYAPLGAGFACRACHRLSHDRSHDQVRGRVATRGQSRSLDLVTQRDQRGHAAQRGRAIRSNRGWVEL